MKSKWELITPVSPDFINELIQKHRIPRPVACVLCNRGLTVIEDVKRFLNPETSQLNDPFLMKDMGKAVDRVIRALREQENILIFGDYDVDGITSVSLLYLFIKDLCGQVSFYIPDRASEGYGLSTGAIEDAHKNGCGLIISVDCGITSIKEVALAKEYGMDVIISDHHEPGEQLPLAEAVLDPKRPDCEYPFKELAGVGVAFKLAQGIVERLELDANYIEKYLDLVAIGSAADIVPLIGENRVFVKNGLDRLNSQGQEGILILLETAGYNPGKIDIGHIVFGLAPRINAVGRLGNASPAVELIVTRNHFRARQIAQMLEKVNQRRKEIDSKTLVEALAIIESDYNLDDEFVIVLARENWHPGVIGIVASRIIEKYHRPTVMITIKNGVGKGSARSIPNFDIHSALKSCSDLLLQFGGHKYAAGLTIRAEDIDGFRERFNQVAAEMLTKDDLIPRIRIDYELRLEEIDFDLLKEIEVLAPFGPKNSKPLFVSYGLQVLGEPRVVGKKHLKFRVRQNGTTLDAIAFNRADDLGLLQKNRTVDLVYHAEENRWMDRISLQLNVKDLR